MRRTLSRSLWLALASLSMIACGAAPGDETATNEGGEGAAKPGAETEVAGVTNDQLTDDERKIIALQREAIDMGLTLGKGAFADELNLLLEDEGILELYKPATTKEASYPLPGGASGCPFTKPAPDVTKENIDCRALVDRAKVDSYGTLSQVQEQNPLDARFDVDRTKNQYDFFQREGMVSGIDNETVLAVSALRTLGVCDQAPTQERSAFEDGVALGRALYIAKLNERLAETGMVGDYPNSINQIEQCNPDSSFIEPARSRAITAIKDSIDASPLCTDYSPQTLDEVDRYATAENQYEQGFRRGIEDEFSISRERIFRVIPCNTGDPLLLDLAGDGVALIPVSQSAAEFDFLGDGNVRRSAWIQGDEAFLVLDRDGSGTIDSGRELFANVLGDHGYNEVRSGFENLSTYDLASLGGNGDGRVDADDAVYSSLQLWQDADGDGVTDPGELMGLRDAGVTTLHLAYGKATAGDQQLLYVGSFDRADGTQGQVYDAFLRTGAPLRLAR